MGKHILHITADIDRVNKVTQSSVGCSWYESYCSKCDWIILWPMGATPKNKCFTCNGKLRPTTEEQREQCPLFINEGADYAALEILLDRMK